LWRRGDEGAILPPPPVSTLFEAPGTACGKIALVFYS
jgi:hypothetical protein